MPEKKKQNCLKLTDESSHEVCSKTIWCKQSCTGLRQTKTKLKNLLSVISTWCQPWAKTISLIYISLSTVVLNSRDWWEIIYGFWKISHFKNQPCNRLYPKNRLDGFWKISRFKNQPCNMLYPKKPAGMHC